MPVQTVSVWTIAKVCILRPEWVHFRGAMEKKANRTLEIGLDPSLCWCYRGCWSWWHCMSHATNSITEALCAILARDKSEARVHAVSLICRHRRRRCPSCPGRVIHHGRETSRAAWAVAAAVERGATFCVHNTLCCISHIPPTLPQRPHFWVATFLGNRYDVSNFLNFSLSYPLIEMMRRHLLTREMKREVMLSLWLLLPILTGASPFILS